MSKCRFIKASIWTLLPQETWIFFFLVHTSWVTLGQANLLDLSLERTSHEIKPMMLCFTVEGKKIHQSWVSPSLLTERKLFWNLLASWNTFSYPEWGMEWVFLRAKWSQVHWLETLTHFNILVTTIKNMLSAKSIILFLTVPKVPVVSPPSSTREGFAKIFNK